MNKSTPYLIIGVLVATFLVGMFLWFKQKDTDTEGIACTLDAKVCPDGSYVGRTGPQCTFAPCPLPVTNNGNPSPTPDDIQAEIDARRDLIRITKPTPLEVLSGGNVVITGEARGTWYFEGGFPVIIVDWDGKIIGEGFATAQGEWMTEDFVPFLGTISYMLPPDTPYLRGSIIFKKDNPSGLPENDDALEIPILFE